ncbi:MAG: 3-oxoacyl-ACP reductase FabG [Clostridiales bacterium]|nr:3-oxoacyl-ACP reductase FabG [Clostridiales bacterium]
MLKGKTALISGGARGIGAAIALELETQGAEIITLDLNSAGVSYQGDVADFAQMKEIVGQIRKSSPMIDILVNNAGLTCDNLLLRMSEADFDRVTDVCLKGAFNLTKQVLPLMLKKRWGRIINITSIVGLTGNAGQANYAAAKAGLIGLTKSLAKEVAGRNITCNAIAPGFIETEMTTVLSEAAKAQLLAQIPAKRPGHPNEVAKLAAFLASENAAYITGEVIRIDGGFAC